MAEKAIYSKIDWFTMIFNDMSFNEILNWLMLDGIQDEFLNGIFERLSGFDNMLIFNYNGISLETKSYNFFSYNNEYDLSCFDVTVPKVRLNISGSGLDFLRSQGMDVEDHLRCEELIPKPSHCTRCDFAFDLINYAPELVDELIAYARDHQTPEERLCCFRNTSGFKYSIRTGGGQKTFYCGATTSDKMLRVYDKRLQHIDLRTGVYIKDNPYDDPESWIRIELQTRNKLSHGLAFGDGDMLSIFRFIYDTYCFVDTLNTNSHNRKPIEFWQILFDWEEIPGIIQNAKFVDFTPFREVVVNTFMNRQLLNFIKVYSLLGREGFLKEVSDRVFSLNDKSNPVMNRRLRCLMLQLNQMELSIDHDSHGLYVDKDFHIRFKY